MSLILSILAIFVGLVGVYLAADTKENVESKIQGHLEYYSNSTKKSLDNCISSLVNLTARIEYLENATENYTDFKTQIAGELAEINTKLSHVRHELIIMDPNKIPKLKARSPEPLEKS
ncbi:MAG: hypothetical protein HN731_12340 [Rhodospirillaceae bacterium]|jgi:hypothetical protein|nr:hypothetical protein [Rhodospirillaceae bacterium]